MANMDTFDISANKNDNEKDTLLDNKSNKTRKTIQTLTWRWIILVFVLIVIVSAIVIGVYFAILKESESESQTTTDFFTIKQPTSIYIHDGSDFVLHVDYCKFELFEENNVTLININTRCYCWNYSESKGINVIPSMDNTDFNLNDYHCDIPGPTLYITNNIKFNITVINDMKGASMSDLHETRMYPDVTNLHTHGLHIDPIWDNVFIAINPGDTVVYHYQVPEDHYPGTHWYHPHIHGSTNYQVHGGMFGAMIVEEKDSELDLEEMTSIILLFHYLYFYTDPFCNCEGKTETDLFNEYTFISSAGGPFQITSLCYDWCMMPVQQRNISGFEYFGNSNISNPTNGLVDIMLLNGEYEPNINIKSDQWYKFRMINSNGLFYTQINFENVLNNNVCNIHLLGNDGIFFNKSRNIRNSPYYNEMIIGPGSRADIAIKCQFISNFSDKISIGYSHNIIGDAGIPRYPIENNTVFYLQIYENELEENKNKTFNSSELPLYNIPYFPDYLTIESDSIITDTCPCYTYDETNNQCHWNFLGQLINGQTANLSKPLLYVCKDKIYEFEIAGVHPVHIHNTPFQIQRDLPSNSNDFNGFIAQQGDWRDTVGINDGNYNIRYPTGHFNGPTIMHCHFLPHEDDGMLGYFQIIDCDLSPQCDA